MKHESHKNTEKHIENLLEEIGQDVHAEPVNQAFMKELGADLKENYDNAITPKSWMSRFMESLSLKLAGPVAGIAATTAVVVIMVVNVVQNPTIPPTIEMNEQEINAQEYSEALDFDDETASPMSLERKVINKDQFQMDTNFSTLPSATTSLPELMMDGSSDSADAIDVPDTPSRIVIPEETDEEATDTAMDEDQVVDEELTDEELRELELQLQEALDLQIEAMY